MFKSCSMDNQYSLLWENLIFQNVPQTSHPFCFTTILMFLVHSSKFSLVRHKTNFLHESPCNSTFLKLPVTAETAGSTRVSESARHSGSLRPVRPKTSFLRHERRKNETPQKVPRTTYTSCFTMTFMSFINSPSLSLLRRPTSILRYEWYDDSAFQKILETTHSSYDDIYVFITFCKFQPCTTQDKFLPSWEVNFAENGGHNLYLLTR